MKSINKNLKIIVDLQKESEEQKIKELTYKIQEISQSLSKNAYDLEKF
jgi:hypothetical protein